LIFARQKDRYQHIFLQSLVREFGVADFDDFQWFPFENPFRPASPARREYAGREIVFSAVSFSISATTSANGRALST